jgi:peptidoglycan/LPS O-acetylase OafA/YrhL
MCDSQLVLIGAQRGPFRAVIVQEQTMKYMRFLDGLRCISIAWVILLHLPFDKSGALGLVASRGWMGVDMFFVISGFLITSLLLAEQDQTGQISLGNFYVRRTLRIWPAYYLLIALTLVLGLGLRAAPGLLPQVSSDAILRTIMWPAVYLTNGYVAYNGTEDVTLLHSWSLALEEQFYLLWPAVLILAGRRALELVIATVVAITAWRIWLTFQYPEGVAAMRRIFYAPDTRMDVLLYGVLVAFAVRGEKCKVWLARWLSRAWVLGALALAFAAVVVATNRWSGWFGNSLGYGCSAAIMACLLAYLVVVRPAGLVRCLEWRPLAYVGKISYGVYLFQSAAIDLLQAVLGTPVTTSRKLLFTAAAYALAIALASASYKYFEAPILKLKSRFAAVPAPVRAATGA